MNRKMRRKKEIKVNGKERKGRKRKVDPGAEKRKRGKRKREGREREIGTEAAEREREEGGREGK